ncbi:MAG TPA: SDR family NAD(P)-dependent oxidoreductase [Bryobacteraceae bacterium]|nr:SDR family NAD(P)-dependent oxidoreductase [Bryobacteraceae bacterium]
MSDHSGEAPVAVVTGSARGIGKATALRLAAENYRIVLSGRNAAALEEVGGEIRRKGGEALCCAGDLGDPAVVGRLMEAAVTGFGRLDVLVNSAGIAKHAPFLEIDPADWQRTLDLHLTATFRCGQAAARIMVEAGRGGRIVNLSSIAASMAMYGTSAYAVAKGGVSSLTRVMAIELAPHRITVNAAAPGPVATEQLRAVYDENAYRQRSRAIPANRLAEPAEVADLIAFLVSPAACYITGQIVTIDGGAAAVGCYSYETFKRAEAK